MKPNVDLYWTNPDAKRLFELMERFMERMCEDACASYEKRHDVQYGPEAHSRFMRDLDRQLDPYRRKMAELVKSYVIHVIRM
jgi:hypothetical protein